MASENGVQIEFDAVGAAVDYCNQTFPGLNVFIIFAPGQESFGGILEHEGETAIVIDGMAPYVAVPVVIVDQASRIAAKRQGIADADSFAKSFGEGFVRFLAERFPECQVIQEEIEGEGNSVEAKK